MVEIPEEKDGMKRRERTQIMTLKEVAKYLGLHPISIYRLISFVPHDNPCCLSGNHIFQRKIYIRFAFWSFLCCSRTFFLNL